MNKTQFTQSLAQKLQMLPHGEVEKSLAFYTEMIDDRMEDGLTEEEAVQALGDIGALAREIMLSAPLPTLVTARMKPKHRLSTWEIVLFVLGFPLWFPLLIAFWSVVLSVYVSIWAVIVSLWAVVLALGASGVVMLVAMPVVLFKNPLSGLLLVAGGALCAGLGMMAFVGMKKLTVLLVELTRSFARTIKKLFVQKTAKGEDANETV